MADEWIPFMRYFDEKDDKGKQRMGPPLKEDWDNAKVFVHFLKNFHDVTLELSASKTPTSHMISVSMFALQIEIEKKCDDSDPIMSEVAKAMKVKFDKYWGDWNKMNPVIFIANVLDPRNKLKMLQVSVKKLKRFGDSNQEVRELCDRFKNDLVTLWAEYKGVSDTLVTQKPLVENSGDGDDTGLGGSGLFDELYNGVQEEVSQDQLNQISNEVDNLYKDPTDDDLAFYQEIEEIEKSSSHSTITQETRDGSSNLSSTG
ncbi:hypothetical protein SASPL_137822 [Salvia splendens]|uniref:hAT-like transposase RNase-H fold domain-containing protein n=1 Tax=Salvia splendens TaxID=180675 RepID=A0A8X8ZDA9_SALSN|nr:hypothetical protein SASPL_137822 [Salvia splendens]